MMKSADIVEAIVLAGGRGTRLSGVVDDVCKPMAPVAGRPFLRFVLDHLAEQGVDRVIVADGYKRVFLEEYFGTSYRGMELVYSPEDRPLLTGGAVKQALKRCVSDQVLVLNGDTFLDIDYEPLFEEARRKDAKCVVTGLRVGGCNRFGTIGVAEEKGLVDSFGEKCASGLVNAGTYLMKRDALVAQSERFSLEGDYFPRTAREGLLRVVEVQGLFIDIGVPDDYRRAQDVMKPFARRWKLAIFDRDGTINVDTGHLHDPDDLELIEKTVDLIKSYNHNPDYRVVVATNQAGIAKGLYGVSEMRAVHRALDEMLAERGAFVDAYYYCPHHPSVNGPCRCRKPLPGMVEKALFDFDSRAEDAVMYGDRDTDRLAAQAAGIDFAFAPLGIDEVTRRIR